MTRLSKQNTKNTFMAIVALTVFCTIIAQCSLSIQMHVCEFDPFNPDSQICGLKYTEGQANAVYGLAIFNIIMVILMSGVQLTVRV